MKNYKFILILILSSVLATLVCISTFFGISMLGGFFNTTKMEYYSMHLCNGEHVNEDCEQILSEFEMDQIKISDISTASLVASSGGESVLILTTKADITDKAENFMEALSDKYSHIKYIELSDVVVTISSPSAKIRQLWRLENNEVRVTAYKGINMDKYVLSVKLPINKLSYARENGSLVSGFPEGRVITEE